MDLDPGDPGWDLAQVDHRELEVLDVVAGQSLFHLSVFFDSLLKTNKIKSLTSVNYSDKIFNFQPYQY